MKLQREMQGIMRWRKQGLKMRVTCKNKNCKHYYKLEKGEHCQAEEKCSHYSNNIRKTEKIKCINCKYCKRVTTDKGTEYHYECNYKERKKLILFVEERVCDYKL